MQDNVTCFRVVSRGTRDKYWLGCDWLMLVLGSEEPRLIESEEDARNVLGITSADSTTLKKRIASLPPARYSRVVGVSTIDGRREGCGIELALVLEPISGQWCGEFEIENGSGPESISGDDGGGSARTLALELLRKELDAIAA